MALARPKQLGRYELLLELGHGGMAELDVARLVGVGGFEKLVAIKRILPHLAQDKQFVELFLNEGRIAAQLSHPNVCQVHELGEADGELYLAMEYLDGAVWDELVTATPFDQRLRLTAGVLGQAAEGLHYAHQLCDLDGKPTPIIHRDVSPQNLLVTLDGVCKVLDFGVAKMMTEGPRTRTGVLKGKIPYMSPEQIRGEPLDPRADVFSLGVVAWEALTGDRLFDRETDFLVWKAIGEEPIPTATSRQPKLPAAIDTVLAQALERDLSRRFATARAFASALQHVAGAPLAAREIAELLRSSCGSRIAERGRRVADAARRERPASAGDTIEDPAETADMKMRREPIAVTRPKRSRWIAIAGALAAVAIATVLAFLWNRGDDDARPVALDSFVVVPPVQAPAPVAPVVVAPAPKPAPKPAAVHVAKAHHAAPAAHAAAAPAPTTPPPADSITDALNTLHSFEVSGNLADLKKLRAIKDALHATDSAPTGSAAPPDPQ